MTFNTSEGVNIEVCGVTLPPPIFFFLVFIFIVYFLFLIRGTPAEAGEFHVGPKGKRCRCLGFSKMRRKEFSDRNTARNLVNDAAQ